MEKSKKKPTIYFGSLTQRLERFEKKEEKKEVDPKPKQKKYASDDRKVGVYIQIPAHLNRKRLDVWKARVIVDSKASKQDIFVEALQRHLKYIDSEGDPFLL